MQLYTQLYMQLYVQLYIQLYMQNNKYYKICKERVSFAQAIRHVNHYANTHYKICKEHYILYTCNKARNYTCNKTCKHNLQTCITKYRNKHHTICKGVYAVIHALHMQYDM